MARAVPGQIALPLDWSAGGSNDGPLIVGTSGRYEFRNKGIDVFIESLKKLAASPRLKRQVLAYITVPAANRGPRADLQAHLAEGVCGATQARIICADPHLDTV